MVRSIALSTGQSALFLACLLPMTATVMATKNVKKLQSPNSFHFTHDWTVRDFGAFVRDFPMDLFLSKNTEKVFIVADPYRQNEGPTSDRLNAIEKDGKLYEHLFGGENGGKVYQLHQRLSGRYEKDAFASGIVGGGDIEQKGNTINITNPDGSGLRLHRVQNGQTKQAILDSLRFVPLPLLRSSRFAGELKDGRFIYVDQGKYDRHESLVRAFFGRPKQMEPLEILAIEPGSRSFSEKITTSQGAIDILWKKGSLFLHETEQTLPFTEVPVKSSFAKELGIPGYDEVKVYIPHF